MVMESSGDWRLVVPLIGRWEVKRSRRDVCRGNELLSAGLDDSMMGWLA